MDLLNKYLPKVLINIIKEYYYDYCNICYEDVCKCCIYCKNENQSLSYCNECNNKCRDCNGTGRGGSYFGKCELCFGRKEVILLNNRCDECKGEGYTYDYRDMEYYECYCCDGSGSK